MWLPWFVKVHFSVSDTHTIYNQGVPPICQCFANTSWIYSTYLCTCPLYSEGVKRQSCFKWNVAVHFDDTKFLLVHWNGLSVEEFYLEALIEIYLKNNCSVSSPNKHILFLTRKACMMRYHLGKEITSTYCCHVVTGNVAHTDQKLVIPSHILLQCVPDRVDWWTPAY